MDSRHRLWTPVNLMNFNSHTRQGIFLLAENLLHTFQNYCVSWKSSVNQFPKLPFFSRFCIILIKGTHRYMNLQILNIYTSVCNSLEAASYLSTYFFLYIVYFHSAVFARISSRSSLYTGFKTIPLSLDMSTVKLYSVQYGNCISISSRILCYHVVYHQVLKATCMKRNVYMSVIIIADFVYFIFSLLRVFCLFLALHPRKSNCVSSLIPCFIYACAFKYCVLYALMWVYVHRDTNTWSLDFVLVFLQN